MQEYYDPISKVTSGPLHKQLGVSKKELGWARESGWGMEEINYMVTLHDPAIQKEEVQWFTTHKSTVYKGLHKVTV